MITHCPILTHKGLEKLHELAESHPKEFSRFPCDGFQGLLGSDDIEAEKLELKQPIELPEIRKFSHTDDAHVSEALFAALPNLSPAQFADRRIPCSIAVFLLGPYARHRWRLYKEDPVKYIHRHSLAGYPSQTDFDLYHTAARLYHLNRVVTTAGGGDEERKREILGMICSNPDPWHRIHQRRYLASNSRAVTAILEWWEELSKSKGKPNMRRKMEAMVREYNKRAAGVFVDQLDDDELKRFVRNCAPADGTLHSMPILPNGEKVNPPPVIRILSLGGGIQSTTMALMASQNQFAYKPDFAIFADTGWEPSYIYDTLDNLENLIDFPILRVGTGRKLSDDVFYGMKPSGSFGVKIPVHLKNGSKSAGMMKRECTTDYKIEPIRKKARELAGIRFRQKTLPQTSIEMWLGITKDEILRVKPSRETYIQHRYPLIEEKDLDRNDCIRWLHDNHPNLKVRKSACIGCPYRGTSAWVEVKRDDPQGFERAVEIDTRMREPGHPWSGLLQNQAYLHSRRIPLDEAVKLDEIAFDSQSKTDSPDFIEACEGLCGT